MPRSKVIRTCVDCGISVERRSTRCLSCANRERGRKFVSSKTPPNPSGLCQCGCGQVTQIAKETHKRSGHVRGQHTRFIRGHTPRTGPIAYVVEDRGYKTPCWVWKRFINPSGYGMTRNDDGISVVAHKAFYERKHGPVPEGMELDHLCRVRACANPDHVEPVTHVENALRGKSTKLSDADVQKIRELRGKLSGPKVGKLFGINSSHVYNIWHGRCRAA